jgi:hypothetical protein
LLTHLRELGLDDGGLDAVKKAFRTYKYQPSYHDVDEFYED